MNSFSPILFLMGQDRLVADERDSAKILSICLRDRIVYSRPEFDGSGHFSVSCTPFMSYALRRECEKNGIAINISDRQGIASIIKKHKSRIGLFLGFLCSVFILMISDNYIWDIRVSGNERVTYTELINTLSDCGLRVGSRISTLDVDSIETRVVLECEDISWITINLEGTYANIQIREVGRRTEKMKTEPSNIVASRDGQIDRLEIFSGNAMVRNGDVVRKGDILVSGLRDSNHYGMFVTRSLGKVYAHTKREFKVEIPFEYEKKTVTEVEIKEKYLIFFSKEIKVFEKGGNIGASCDTIEGVENLRFFTGDRLPIGFRTVKAVSYSTETMRYTNGEAMNVAYYTLREMIEAELSDAELLSKNIEYEITDEAYVLYCTVECVEDIAIEQKFEYVIDP